MIRPTGDVEPMAESSEDLPELGSPRRRMFLVEMALELLTLFRILDQRSWVAPASSCDGSVPVEGPPLSRRVGGFVGVSA